MLGVPHCHCEGSPDAAIKELLGRIMTLKAVAPGKRIEAMLGKLFGLRREQPPINTLLQQISKRAERLDPKQQAETFVSIGGIEATLLNPDHRVIFGRRGTGKTHVMSFVAGRAKQKGEIAIRIDMRTTGSNSYIYGDPKETVATRSTFLLRDFV